LIENVITPKTKAILPVHLYGHPAAMDRIVEIANGNGLYVVEDCAQSHGAQFNGKKTGSLGDIAAFSFYPTKNLGAIGDGGMVVTNDPDLAEKALLIRQYGWEKRDMSIISGMNSRLDEIQAAILSVKLQYLDNNNLKRRHIADVYGKLLPKNKVIIPAEANGAYHVYHQYVIRTPKRDELRAFLADHGINTQIHYPTPVHLQPAYQHLLINQKLIKTETVCNEIVSFPMHPFITDDEATTICELTNDFFEGG
jgi:dTDP-4-amino-4,6-dideoxygalactose transaminase